MGENLDLPKRQFLGLNFMNPEVKKNPENQENHGILENLNSCVASQVIIR